MSKKIPTEAELEAAAVADEELLDRIVDEAGRAVCVSRCTVAIRPIKA
jgi:ribosomal protein S25